jgi:hypothetical protein
MFSRIRAWLSCKLIADATPEDDICESCRKPTCTESQRVTCDMLKQSLGDSIGPGGGIRVGEKLGRKTRVVR